MLSPLCLGIVEAGPVPITFSHTGLDVKAPCAKRNVGPVILRVPPVPPLNPHSMSRGRARHP
jgi:hypothetical protein